MIYILVGNDNKAKNAHLQTILKKGEQTHLSKDEISKESFINVALGANLFGGINILVLSEVLSQVELKDQDLKILQSSENIFVFLEEKLLTDDKKRYGKYGEVLVFDEKKIPKKETFNTFAIADAFASKDKIKTWILYREAIEAGIAPEAISGILFWKVKTMILNNTKTFSQDSLKKQSGDLVSLYHKSHRGECDFTTGLEQFILSSLGK